MGLRKSATNTKNVFITITTVTLLILISFFTYVAIEDAMFEKKMSFTILEVENAASKIFEQNMGFRSAVEVTYWNEKKEGSQKNAPVFKSADITLLNSQNFYIYTYGGGGFFDIHYTPSEIKASFECLLYFDGKELPGKLIGILNHQTVGGIDNYSSNKPFISVTEFEQLCTEVDIEGLSRRKAAEKLAEYWIEKHNYVKR